MAPKREEVVVVEMVPSDCEPPVPSLKSNKVPVVEAGSPAANLSAAAGEARFAAYQPLNPLAPKAPVAEDVRSYGPCTGEPVAVIILGAVWPRSGRVVK